MSNDFEEFRKSLSQVSPREILDRLVKAYAIDSKNANVLNLSVMVKTAKKDLRGESRS